MFRHEICWWRSCYGSLVTYGGVKMKLLAICKRSVRGQAGTAPRDCLLTVMDDRVGWRKRSMGVNWGQPSSSSCSILICLHPSPHRPSGKASTSRAADLSSIPAFAVTVFPGWVIPVTSKLVPQWLPCQAPGVVWSVLGLVGLVSVYCYWMRWKVWSTTSISVWQHAHSSKETCPWYTQAWCWDVNTFLTK